MAESLEERQLMTAGDLDLTFGTGGSVQTATLDHTFSAEIQADGKILASGNGGGSPFGAAAPHRHRGPGLVVRFGRTGPREVQLRHLLVLRQFVRHGRAE